MCCASRLATNAHPTTMPRDQHDQNPKWKDAIKNANAASLNARQLHATIPATDAKTREPEENTNPASSIRGPKLTASDNPAENLGIATHLWRLQYPAAINYTQKRILKPTASTALKNSGHDALAIVGHAGGIFVVFAGCLPQHRP